MTPVEKAKELFDKFYQEAPLDEIKFYSNNVMAKSCALIAVDELIKEARFSSKYIEEVFFTTGYYDKQDYWQEVKQEIDKL
jgi:hypothetical protein